MSDARKRAGELREQIEQTPAGAIRDEANAELKDAIQAADEQLREETGAIALDPAKLDVKNVDNEIASKWNAERGDIPFSKPQDGYLYAWVTSENSHGDAAKTSIRALIARMRRVGWHPVEGDMPEGREFIGKDCASATTHRGVADTELWRIRREEWAKVEEVNWRRQQRDNGIEADFIEKVMRETRGAAMGFDLSDPRFARQYGGNAMKPVTYSANFSERQIRDGTGPMRPGFEIPRS